MPQIEDCCKQLLKNRKILVLDWPDSNPDVNSIKNFWVVLKNKASEEQPSCLKQLEKMIKSVWTGDIIIKYCCKLIGSMPRPLKMVIHNKDRHTKY